MIPWIGDFAEDETLYHYFNTFSSDDPAASVTITNLADADLKVHKDGGTTEATTDGATISIDFDGVTGTHLVTIDTSADAFYATGSDYMVRMEGMTVDGATINAALFTFSIQNRYSAGALRPTTAARTLDVTAGGAAGIDWGNVENQSTAVDLSATDIQLVDTCTTNTDMRGTNSAATAVDLATVDANVDAILVDTNELQTDDIPTTLATIAGYLDTEIAAILEDTGTTIPGLIATAQADLDIITGADGVNLLSATQASIDAVEADTNELQTDDTPSTLATIDGKLDTIDAIADSILEDTGTTLPAAIPSVNDIQTTQMTESYAANGVAPTLAQSLFAIHQMLMSFAISGTSFTVRRLNNSTTAFVVTLDDDTSPTAQSRS